MIVCHIELWPGGDKRRAKRIFTLHATVAVGTKIEAARADYQVRLLEGVEGSAFGDWRRGEVRNFRRVRGAAALVAEALNVLLTEEEKRA